MNQTGIFKSVVGKKYIMGLTGLFLITFLIVHLGINLCALIPDGGETFNMAAEFMGSPFIKPLEIGLFLGFIGAGCSVCAVYCEATGFSFFTKKNLLIICFALFSEFNVIFRCHALFFLE
jgi:succinate dehydrogenase / fumarate reductase cytochrome b subunit